MRKIVCLKSEKIFFSFSLVFLNHGKNYFEKEYMYAVISWSNSVMYCVVISKLRKLLYYYANTPKL